MPIIPNNPTELTPHTWHRVRIVKDKKKFKIVSNVSTVDIDAGWLKEIKLPKEKVTGLAAREALITGKRIEDLTEELLRRKKK